MTYLLTDTCVIFENLKAPVVVEINVVIWEMNAMFHLIKQRVFIIFRTFRLKNEIKWNQCHWACLVPLGQRDLSDKSQRPRDENVSMVDYKQSLATFSHRSPREKSREQERKITAGKLGRLSIYAWRFPPAHFVLLATRPSLENRRNIFIASLIRHIGLFWCSWLARPAFGMKRYCVKS